MKVISKAYSYINCYTEHEAELQLCPLTALASEFTITRCLSCGCAFWVWTRTDCCKQECSSWGEGICAVGHIDNNCPSLQQPLGRCGLIHTPQMVMK
jgi:hypothetical protein